MSIVYLNGKFLPIEDAYVPVLDRGFVFGDGVYEVIPVYGGHLFRLAQHLERLAQSLAGVRITAPLSCDQWRDILVGLIKDNGGGDQSLYLQITRGVAPRDHAFPKNTSPTVFAMSTPLSPIPTQMLEQGVVAVTLDDIRWKNCHIKSINLLPNVLLRQEAIDQGALEAILVRDGNITEGAASNIFMVKNGVILTPPKGPQLLPGITHDLILELAAQNGMPYRECNITQAEFVAADELWLSSSTREVLPITLLNGQPVGIGKPGELWRRMFALYQGFKQNIRQGLDGPKKAIETS